MQTMRLLSKPGYTLETQLQLSLSVIDWPATSIAALQPAATYFLLSAPVPVQTPSRIKTP